MLEAREGRTGDVAAREARPFAGGFICKGNSRGQDGVQGFERQIETDGENDCSSKERNTSGQLEVVAGGQTDVTDRGGSLRPGL